MHRAAPGTEWRLIESANAIAEAKRLSERGAGPAARGSADSIAPGLAGRWYERGSNNLAGSIRATAYDPDTDALFAVSAGGTLWRGPADGSAWAVVDQTRRYEPDALLLVERAGAAPQRLLAGVDRRVVYSDDDGATWTTATGISAASNYYSGTWDIALALDGADTLLYLLSTSGYYDDIELYRSRDLGQSWSRITNADMGTRSQHVDLVADPRQGAPWLLTEAGVSRVSPSGVMAAVAPAPAKADRRRLAAAAGDSSRTVLYTFDDANTVHRSDDGGQSWTPRGTLVQDPWSVGLFVNPDNPDQLVAGAVDAEVSYDGGASWVPVNRWFEYYRDVERMLHADMMSFAHYRRRDGSTFTVSANHGGLYRTADFFRNSLNIGLAGLNVGQFYDVTSHAAHPGWVFGGTQDQGFQRGALGQPTRAADLEQAISGDYGHLTFNADGSRLWMVYPGTMISYWDEPREGSRSGRVQVESDDESVWLPPMVAHPDPRRESVLVAGGSIAGGGGSFILEAQADEQAFEFPVTDWTYDFLAETRAELTALGTSPLSTTRVYAATQAGRFFVTDDLGATWRQASGTYESGHYLYGQAIEASPVVADRVWLAGSGYTNPGVFRSDDGGLSFAPDDLGLPRTMVFELASSPDGAWLFAATEAGPYGQLVSEGRWYPLRVPGVPVQTFWSVDYVASDSIVRFGTYGRGIWDLKILAGDPVVSVAERAASAAEPLRLSPNPASTTVRLGLPETAGASAPAGEPTRVEVFDGLGRRVLAKAVSDWSGTTGAVSGYSLDISGLAPGSYTVSVRRGERRHAARLLVRR